MGTFGLWIRDFYLFTVQWRNVLLFLLFPQRNFGGNHIESNINVGDDILICSVLTTPIFIKLKASQIWALEIPVERYARGMVISLYAMRSSHAPLSCKNTSIIELFDF